MTNCDFGYLFSAIFVLFGVFLEARWEREDRAIDLKYDPIIERSYALVRISSANLNLYKEYEFWRSIYCLYDYAWIYADSMENKLKIGIESIDYGKIAISIGDAILEKKGEQK